MASGPPARPGAVRGCWAPSLPQQQLILGSSPVWEAVEVASHRAACSHRATAPRPPDRTTSPQGRGGRARLPDAACREHPPGSSAGRARPSRPGTHARRAAASPWANPAPRVCACALMPRHPAWLWSVAPGLLTGRWEQPAPCPGPPAMHPAFRGPLSALPQGICVYHRNRLVKPFWRVHSSSSGEPASSWQRQTTCSCEGLHHVPCGRRAMPGCCRQESAAELPMACAVGHPCCCSGPRRDWPAGGGLPGAHPGLAGL